MEIPIPTFPSLYLHPNESQNAAMLRVASEFPERPIAMLNLLRFHKLARYRDADLAAVAAAATDTVISSITGRDAYITYGTNGASGFEHL